MPSIELSEPAPSPRRAGRTRRGWLLRGVFWGACIAILAAILAIGSGWRPWQSLPTPVVKPPRTTPGDPLATSARRAAKSVVAIQTVGQGNTRNLGAGFVIAEGLVATNFHVVASATEAQVRFADGRIFAIAGYASADAAHDLALLRMVEPPRDVAALPLAEEDVDVATQVMAIGHPRGVAFAFVEGRISQRVTTAELPADSQRFVRKLTGAGDDLRWLQHTATLAEGNSGGPLVDAEGRVVGVNTWINRQAGTNFALDATLLRTLVNQASEQTQSLAELARPDVQAAALVARLTAERIEALYSEAERIGWLPATAADYRPLSELALAMTAAQLPQTFQGDQSDRSRADELQAAATRIEQKLRDKKPFGSPDQITIVNEQAARVLSRSSSGVFCFAEVERIVEGERGQRGMLMKLIGDNQPLFVSLDGRLFQPMPGEVYALLGANLHGEVVRYGDNPLQLVAAPVIVSRTFVPITP